MREGFEHLTDAELCALVKSIRSGFDRMAETPPEILFKKTAGHKEGSAWGGWFINVILLRQMEEIAKRRNLDLSDQGFDWLSGFDQVSEENGI